MSVESSLTSANLPAISGCAFTYDDGSKCLSLDIKARNLCGKHYQALRRIGAFDNDARKSDQGEVVANAVSLDRAKDRLERAAPFAASLMVRAAKAAALKGDSKPAQWILLHSRAIEPIEKNGPPSHSPLTVNVGVKLAGVRSVKSASTPLTITASPVDNRQE